MKPSEEKQLKAILEANPSPNTKMGSRWDLSTLVEVNKAFEKAGKKKCGLPSSPFNETEDGLIDFRGFYLLVQLVRLHLNNMDFSWMSSALGSLVDCIFEDCILRGSDFDGHFFCKRFIRCDLSKISLKNGAIGDSVFIECDFSGANLTSATARGAKFIRCNFGKTNFSSNWFHYCEFEHCVFHGAKYKNSSMCNNKYIGEQPEFKPNEFVITIREEKEKKELTLHESITAKPDDILDEIDKDKCEAFLIKEEIQNRISELGGTFNFQGESLKDDLMSISFEKSFLLHGFLDDMSDNDYKRLKYELKNKGFVSESELVAYSQIYPLVEFAPYIFTPFKKGTDDYIDIVELELDYLEKLEPYAKSIIGEDVQEFLVIDNIPCDPYGEKCFICLADKTPENPTVYKWDEEALFNLEMVFDESCLGKIGTLEDYFNNFVSVNEYKAIIDKFKDGLYTN